MSEVNKHNNCVKLLDSLVFIVKPKIIITFSVGIILTNLWPKQ